MNKHYHYDLKIVHIRFRILARIWPWPWISSAFNLQSSVFVLLIPDIFFLLHSTCPPLPKHLFQAATDFSPFTFLVPSILTYHKVAHPTLKTPYLAISTTLKRFAPWMGHFALKRNFSENILFLNAKGSTSCWPWRYKFIQLIYFYKSVSWKKHKSQNKTKPDCFTDKNHLYSI